jgi:hypothetical protein
MIDGTGRIQQPGQDSAVLVSTLDGLQIPQEILRSHGVRILQRLPEDNLPPPSGAELIILDCTGLDDVALDQTMGVYVRTGNTRSRLIAVIDAEQIDRVSAWLAGCGAALLCLPSAEDWQWAIAERLHQHKRMHDHAADSLEVRLKRLAEETRQIVASPHRDEPALAQIVSVDWSTAAIVRDVIRARRTRERFFPDGLLMDPAWDILLDLYATALEGGSTTISNACIASCAPPTTALRWIGLIEQAGLIERVPDQADKRRVLLKLSGSGAREMSSYIDTIRRTGLPLV